MTTFPEVLDALRIPYALGGTHHHVTPGNVGIDCPQCSPGSGKFKLGFHEARKRFRCWSCGPLPLAETLAEASGEPLHVVFRLLDGLDRRFSSVPVELKRGKLVLPEGIGPMKAIHRKYLKGRGFDPDELEAAWNVQGIGLSKRLSWRLFVPIHRKGKVVSWTTRATSDKAELRWINAGTEEESFPAKEWLYGLDLAGHSIVVVEGPSDTWRIGPGAAGTGGLGFSQAQVRLIARFPNRSIIFDNEPRAQARARQLADAVGVFPGTTRIVQIDAPDPGSASPKEVALIRRSFL
jgi:hypothetical protein